MVGAGILALSSLSACGEGLEKNAVVKVGNRMITKATFEHWMAIAATSHAAEPLGDRGRTSVPEVRAVCAASLKAGGFGKHERWPEVANLGDGCKQRYQAMKDEVLGFLISSDWTLDEAEVLGVATNPREVRRVYQEIRQQQFPTTAAFNHYLARSGLTLDDLLWRVKVSLLTSKIQHKIIDAATKVTYAQVRRYYNEHAARFTVAERRNLRILRTKTEGEARHAKNEVQSGMPFAAAAKRYQLGEVGGSSVSELRGITEGEGEIPLDRAVFAAAAGMLSGPIKTPSGYYVFEVSDIERRRRKTLGEVRTAIEQQLAAREQQVPLRHFLTEFRQNWIAKTECRVGYVMPDCKEYMS